MKKKINPETHIFILCGGKGTRLDHEGKIKAKPMVQITKPLLMHLIEKFLQSRLQ